MVFPRFNTIQVQCAQILSNKSISDKTLLETERETGFILVNKYSRIAVALLNVNSKAFN